MPPLASARNALAWSLGLVIGAIGCGGDGGRAPADSGPGCGDGLLQVGEECDDSDANSDTTASACRTNCEAPTCGDGVVDDDEECDEGRDNDDDQADACREACVNATCGDGVVDTGEECDDGDADENNECRGDCTSTALWTVLDDLGGTWGNAFDVAVDADDNIVVVGRMIGTGGSVDALLWKLDPTGATIWTRTYDGAAGADDLGFGVAVDGAGNIVAGGVETTAAGDLDAWIRKYDSDGNTIWTQPHDGPGNGDDFISEIGTDPAGDVFVAGRETGAGGDIDIWIRKYDGAGATIWTDTVDEAGDDDYARGLAVDGAGNVLALGTLTDAEGDLRTWVQKYANDGTSIWQRTYPPTGILIDVGLEAVAVDNAANVLLTGVYRLFGAWLGKLDPDGTDVWSRLHEADSTVDSIYGNDVAADGTGNVLVTAVLVRPDGSTDFVTLKYDSSGAEVWSRRLDLEHWDVSNAVAADSAGNVIVVGVVQDPSGAPRMFIRKYEP